MPIQWINEVHSYDTKQLEYAQWAWAILVFFCAIWYISPTHAIHFALFIPLHPAKHARAQNSKAHKLSNLKLLNFR